MRQAPNSGFLASVLLSAAVLHSVWTDNSHSAFALAVSPPNPPARNIDDTRVELLRPAGTGASPELLAETRAANSGGAWKPISYLPLAGSPIDVVTGGMLSYSRDSIAFNRDGSVVTSGQMRSDRFAVDLGRTIEIITPDTFGLRPFAADGCTVYGATGSDMYSSSDGRSWTFLDHIPKYIRSAFVTQTGAILVAADDYTGGRIYRRAPDGGPFNPVLDLEVGFPWHWNYVDTGTHIFVSEYGRRTPPNARRVYRSSDDGSTWDLVYDPEYSFTHNHMLLWDPYDQRVIQTTGDFVGNHLMIVSPDDGNAWEVARLHFGTLPSLNYGAPTSGLSRPEGVYWGLDGAGPTGVQRQVRSSGHWETVLAVGFDDPPRDDQFDANVYDMIEHQGLLYAAFSQVRASRLHNSPALYTSADGEHWTVAARFGTDERGIKAFLGACDGRLWGQYVPGFHVSSDNQVIAIGPPRVHRLILGTRLEGAGVNLWDTPDISSAEGTLEGWVPVGGASLEIDTSMAWHGAASVHVTREAAQISGVALPQYRGDLVSGTAVSVVAHLYGKPRELRLEIVDDSGRTIGRTVFQQMSERWAPAICSATVSEDTTSLTVRLVQRFPRPELAFWVDGVMLSVGPLNDTWQVGGQPREAERLVYDLDFPSTWTDLFLWVPDPGTDGPGAATRTLKVYQASDGATLSVVYDPAEKVMQLVDSVRPSATVVTPPFLLAQSAVLRVAVMQSLTSRTLFVQIAEDPYVGTAPAEPLDIVRIVIGADADGQGAAGGIHARHALFDQVANTEELSDRFIELIQAVPD